MRKFPGFYPKKQATESRLMRCQQQETMATRQKQNGSSKKKWCQGIKEIATQKYAFVCIHALAAHTAIPPDNSHPLQAPHQAFQVLLGSRHSESTPTWSLLGNPAPPLPTAGRSPPSWHYTPRCPPPHVGQMAPLGEPGAETLEGRCPLRQSPPTHPHHEALA